MSSTIDASAIDAAPGAAVESRAMPNVVAIAADRDGMIYVEAAGPRVVGGTDRQPDPAVLARGLTGDVRRRREGPLRRHVTAMPDLPGS